MLTIRKEQYDALERAAVAKFHRRLFGYLLQEFPEYTADQAQTLFSDCIAWANRSRIATEYGLTSFAFVSFHLAENIANDANYRELHQRCLNATGDAE